MEGLFVWVLSLHRVPQGLSAVAHGNSKPNHHGSTLFTTF